MASSIFLIHQSANRTHVYFEINKHGRNTRNSGILMQLPINVKLEFGRCAFRFAAAKIYNELPKEIRAENDYKLFRLALDEYFR